MQAGIVVGGDKGGIGKDLMAELLALTLITLGYSPRIIELEIERRMAAKFASAEFIATGAFSPETLYARPDLVFEPMDKAAALMASSDLTIVNLGASLTTAFLTWSEAEAGQAFFGDGASLHFVCPLVMQAVGLRAGLANLAAFGERYPAARRTAVLNPLLGDFIEGDMNIERALEAAKGDAGPIGVVRIERMSAPGWGYISNMGRLDEVVANKTWRDLVALGLPEGPSIRSMALLEGWLKRSIAALQPVLSPANPDKRKAKR